MRFIFPVICIVSGSLQSVFKKKLDAKCEGCEIFLSALISFFALIYFCLFGKSFVFDFKILPYSIAFSVCYAMAAATCVLALACGSLAFTDLTLAYSGIIPLFYSMFFCDEALKGVQILGILFLGLSFLFTYYPSGQEKGKITLKWIIYVSLLFVSNGMCAVLMRMQQNIFMGEFDSSFMIISLIIAVIFLLILSIIKDGKACFRTLKTGWLLCTLCGGCNGTANYFGLLCLMMIPGVVYYPLTASGGLILSYIFSVTIFKEKFTKNQIIGFILDILSMILINIK